MSTFWFTAFPRDEIWPQKEIQNGSGDYENFRKQFYLYVGM